MTCIIKRLYRSTRRPAEAAFNGEPHDGDGADAGDADVDDVDDVYDANDDYRDVQRLVPAIYRPGSQSTKQLPNI